MLHPHTEYIVGFDTAPVWHTETIALCGSLRYYRHSGPVIYMSKFPEPSVSMPCDYRILQSPIKEQVKLVLWETVGRSHTDNP